MADALITHLARALHLPPDAAQQTLQHLVSTLREQIEATGEAAVPGLGVFSQSNGRLAFEPDDALVRAVNHRYAGLDPVAAAAPRPAPPDEDTASEAAFRPLPSFIEDESDESDAIPDEEAAADHADAVEEPDPEPAEASLPTDEEDASPAAFSDEAEDQPDASLDAEGADLPLVGDEELAEAELDDPTNLEPEPDEETEDEPEGESNLDQLLAGTWVEGTQTEGAEAHPLGTLPEEPAEDAEYSLVEDEADAEAGDETTAAPVPLPSVEPVTEEPDSVSEGTEPEPLAPAVAATAAADRPPVEPEEDRTSRGPVIAGLVVGTLLALAFLLWMRSREPAPPPVAQQPPVADTSAATALPADTGAVALTDPAPVDPPDPLRSDAGVDPAEGGFTWVVASELDRAAAERRVDAYREQGWRAGVVAQEAGGRTRYRVSLGQFDTIPEAEARRADLPSNVPADSWILRL